MNKKITIVNMSELNQIQRHQAAQLLAESLPIGWPTFQEAMDELEERLIPENTMLAALRENCVVGWGGILAPIYGGNVFELHPLAVQKEYQRQGIGKALVLALEQAAKEQGGLTLYLGSDDEKEEGETSLAKADLYDNLPGKMQNFVPGTHASGFYLKMGFHLVGVLPNANGLGKPDLFFAKSLV